MSLIYSSGRLLLIEAAHQRRARRAGCTAYHVGVRVALDRRRLRHSLVVAAVGIFAARLSVIPGGLGFKEGGAAAGAAMVGMPAAVGLTVSVIDRAVMLVWLLFLGVPATLYLQRKTGIDLATASEERAAPTDRRGEAATS